MGLGHGGNGEMLIKWYLLSVIRWVSAENLMYSMMATVNNTVTVLHI